VSFYLQGGPQLQRRLTALREGQKDILRNVGLAAVREAKILVPRRTGNLGRTIRVGGLTDSYVEVRAGGTSVVGYAAYVEFGTRAHLIVPRTKSILAWGGSRTLGGRLRKGSRATIFARRVNHPGTKPKPFLIPGIEKAIRMVGLSDLVRRWNGAA